MGANIPLHKKARLLEENILDRHMIDGLYTSIILVTQTGKPLYKGLQGGILHAVSWTGVYLVGLAFKYAATRDEEVRKHAWEVLKALRRLQELTGVPGFVARGYVKGHGPSLEERLGIGIERPWRQGKGRLSEYRWVDSPSHHNYDHLVRGYGFYYLLAADEEQKAFIKEDVEKIGSNAYSDTELVVKGPGGKPVTFLRGIAPRNRPSMRMLMATSALKIISHITGEGKYEELYRRLCKELGYYKAAEKGKAGLDLTPRQGHDDAEHVLGDLYLMFKLETDPRLLKFYRLAVEEIFSNFRDDGHSLYNFIYAAVTGDLKGANLGQALETLRRYPLNKLFEPKMNSIRNIDRSRPLPIDERPIDNEYSWKGNPYQLDGWLARTVVSLEVAPEDPMVMFAVDEVGRAYRSLDGGHEWEEVRVGPSVRVNDVLVSPLTLRIALAATDKGIYRSDNGGETWRPFALEGVEVKKLMPDPGNSAVVYAMAGDGVYRSAPIAVLKWYGSVWEKLTGSLPAGKRRVFAVLPSRQPVIYAAVDGYVFKLDQRVFKPLGPITEMAHVDVLNLYIDPSCPDRLYALCLAEPGDLNLRFIACSVDGGLSWRAVGLAKLIPPPLGVGTGLEEAKVNDFTLWSGGLAAACDDGLYVSRDHGMTWERMADGLHIPVLKRALSAGNVLYASGPGGLYRLEGEQWRRILVLNGPGAYRFETGSVDFFIACRYHGYISPED